ncbi:MULTISPECIES: HPP family protein [unclassified Streptomyces]|uniref:HPP family protein n=1 Tax=unclassified Streptomyces TaxID=2593676 RepID=UPI00068CD228|nr:MULTISPECIES: HPP family protein [unclassified Streptomyces]
MRPGEAPRTPGPAGRGGHGGRPDWRGRLVAGVRLFLLSAVLLAGVGAIGQSIGWVALTTTLGPTAYLLLAHPDSVGARLRSAVVGHACAIACGLACLAVFGLWSHPSIAAQHSDTARQIGAEALAVGLTLFFLHLFDSHHPPAAATALLIASGISRPGPPLYGMLVGLALVLALAPLLATATSGLTRKRQGS